MSDFRSELYQQYVSAFKGNIDDLSVWWQYIEKRYFPHFSHLPRTASILELGCGAGVMLGFLQETRV